MSTLRFEVETISPMFLRGADSERPELRSTSLKGILRYWWRATEVLPVDELRRREGRIFGSSSDGEGFQSTVVVRLRARGGPLRWSNHRPVPHKRFTAKGFDPRQRFEIILRRKPTCPISLDELRSTAYVALQLSGLGYRSRRGFGAVRIVSIDGEHHELDDKPLKPVYEALSMLNSDFHYEPALLDRRGYHVEEGYIRYEGDTRPPYPWIEEIVASIKFYEDVSKVLTEISRATHKYDSKYTGSPRPRFSSPIFVTLQGDQYDYWPVATTLHLPSSTENKLRGRDTRFDFKDAVIR
jgi:CRISPR-associated protein Cmr1